MNKVFITGFSAVSSLGIGIEKSIKALEQKKQLIKFPEKNDKFHRPYIPLSEEIKTEKTNIRASAIALKLVSLLEDKFFSINEKIPIFSSTSTGGISETEDAYLDAVEKGISYPLFERHFFDKIINDIKKEYKERFSYGYTFSTACSSSGHSIMQAYKLIKKGIIKKACIIGVDVLSKTTMIGFDSLKLVSTTGTKPLTLERDGLTLGEGGGILLLESDPVSEPAAEITGAFSNVDAYHISSPDPNGTKQKECMNEALQLSGIKPSEIDYINAHGTGTMINDEVEMKIIKETFSSRSVVTSLKSFVGHTLGASAALEIALALGMLGQGIIYQPDNIGNPMDESYIPKENVKKNVRYFLKNSFGFGGNNVSIVIKKQ